MPDENTLDHYRPISAKFSEQHVVQKPISNPDELRTFEAIHISARIGGPLFIYAGSSFLRHRKAAKSPLQAHHPPSFTLLIPSEWIQSNQKMILTFTCILRSIVIPTWGYWANDIRRKTMKADSIILFQSGLMK